MNHWSNRLQETTTSSSDADTVVDLELSASPLTTVSSHPLTAPSSATLWGNPSRFSPESEIFRYIDFGDSPDGGTEEEHLDSGVLIYDTVTGPVTGNDAPDTMHSEQVPRVWDAIGEAIRSPTKYQSSLAELLAVDNTRR
nr:uncharacterized protein I303_07778 [Kwoniella dejecticola CBS 10117]OBR81868.1 hypothetical protein I303_07778 [Kwoniella dejecticola CBS 10117]